MARQIVVDQYSPLSHKKTFDNPSAIAPTWVPVDDQRRLAAYRVYAAYLENVARELLRETDKDIRRNHREYGDVELLVSRVVSGVLGDEITIAVDGADADLPERPVVPEPPADPGEAASDVERVAFDAQRRVWEQRARTTVAEWEAAWAAQPALQERQEWLRSWADSELFDQAVWECETEAAGLGDGVYVLGLSSVAHRPVVRVYDPGFYFPVLDDEAAARGYPTMVHVVYEIDTDDDGQPDVVRRVTWRLGSISPRFDGEGQPIFDDNDRLVLADGDRVDQASGRIVRRYPWAADEDSAVTCYMTDATWPLRDLRGQNVAGFPPETARYALNEDGDEIRDLDLRIDFLPIVHIPNTPASQTHYGKSVLARVLQLFDDIAATDSDLQDAAALAGTPMVAVSGASVPTNVTVKPGAFVAVGPNGRMDTLDLSASVDALRNVVDDLLDRLAVNSQVAASVLGRIKPSEVSSGVEMALHFGPYRSLIALLRLVRDQKYRLLLKFVQRLAMAGGYLEAGEPAVARLVFGSFLPDDRKALIDEVVKLVDAKLLSRATGIRVLVGAGIAVEDVPDELARIASTDFEGANDLVDATGDEDAARSYLGLAGGSANPEPPPAPAPVLNL